jgi:hypothetical protein
VAEPESSGFRPTESQSQKLTEWENEPSLLDLKSDFDVSKDTHNKQMVKIDHWNDLMFVRGRAKPNAPKNRSQVQPKLIRRQAEWRYSALTEPFLGSNKLFKVSPVTWEDEEAAKQNELLLNHQFRVKLNRVKFIDDFVRSTVDEGTAILRYGWLRNVTTVKETVPTFQHFAMTTEEEAQALQQALQLREENPRGYEDQVPPELKAAVDYFDQTQQPTVAVQNGVQEIDVEKILQNEPTVEVLNPKNVYLDPTCNGDMNKALFTVVAFETNKAELLKNPETYKNLDKVNWSTNTPISDAEYETQTPNVFEFKDDLRKKVVAYEYWGFYDIHGNGELVPIVATWIGDTIIRLEESPFSNKKLPFIVVPYLPVKRELYGEPDAELLEDNQKIQGALTRGIIDLLGRSANSQIGLAKGLLDPMNRNRYDRGEDYEFNPSMNPTSHIIEHKYPELPQSAMIMLNSQNQEAEALTGVKSFGGGMSGEAYGEVAAGIRGVLDAASKREMAILRRLAKGVTELGQAIISMNADFLSEQEVIRVTNTQFAVIKREEIQGQFDLEVDISTAEVDNQKSQDLSFMLQTIGNSMDFGMTKIILSEIAELKRMPALAYTIKTFEPQPSPAQQRLEELAIQKAELENEELQSQIELNRAKARQAEAQADKTDLDYVEQETGTTHARNMQKQKAQSEGNQNLQVTKALTTPKKEGEAKPDIDAAVGFNELSKRLSNDGIPDRVDNSFERDQQAESDPRFSIYSRFYQPSLDPASNPNMSI